MTKKHKTFSFIVDPEWLDRLEKAVELSDCDFKYEFVIKAAEEKMEKVESESVKK